MPQDDCPEDALRQRLVALEFSLAGFKELMEERDKRYAQRAMAQDEAVSKALDTSKEAVTKAEGATERRLETLNELRGVVVDQARDFARKAEVQLLVAGMEKRIESISMAVTTKEAHGGGVKDAFGWVIGAGGVIIGGLIAYLKH